MDEWTKCSTFAGSQLRGHHGAVLREGEQGITGHLDSDLARALEKIIAPFGMLLRALRPTELHYETGLKDGRAGGSRPTFDSLRDLLYH